MSSSSSSSGWLLAGNTSHNYITGQSSQQSGSIFSIFSFLFLSFLNFTDNSGPISTIFIFLFFSFKTSQWANLYHFHFSFPHFLKLHSGPIFTISLSLFNNFFQLHFKTCFSHPTKKKHKHSSKSPFNHE